MRPRGTSDIEITSAVVEEPSSKSWRARRLDVLSGDLGVSQERVDVDLSVSPQRRIDFDFSVPQRRIDVGGVKMPSASGDKEKPITDEQSIGRRGAEDFSVEQLDEMVRVQREYELTESVWDTTVLIKTLPVGDYAALYTWALLLFNLLLQSTLVYIITTQLTAPTITTADVEDYAEWRRNSAHDVRYMDQLTKTSMAAMVCRGSKAVVHSTVQGQAHENLVAYLGETTVFDAGSFTPGSFTCLIALAVWALTIVNELNHAIQLITIIVELPTGSSRATRCEETRSWKIERLSNATKCELVLVQVIAFECIRLPLTAS